MPHYNDPALVRELLHTPTTWAVVGLGNHPHRTAFSVSLWLTREIGMQLVPIHPDTDKVHGFQGYARLADVPDGTRVGVVDFFVNSSRVGALVDEAIAEKDRLGIGAIWLQLGVIDEEAAQRAKDAGLGVVMDTCPKIEWPRIEPGDGVGVLGG